MLRVFTAAIAACILVLPSVAQDGTASLTGKVNDITGAGVPGTVAQLESEREPINRFRTVADRAGVFRFSALPAGEYNLKLSQAGFQTLAVKSIQILDGEQKSIPALALAIGSVADCGGHAVLDDVRFLPSRDNIGDLSGAVRVDEGQGKSTPISSADVTLICRGGKACAVAKTDSSGGFLFQALPPGDFSIRVTKAGFYPEVEPSYTVQGGIESIYTPISIERCHLGNCDPKRRPKKPLRLCM